MACDAHRVGVPASSSASSYLLDDLEVAEGRCLTPVLAVGDVRDPRDEQEDQHDGVGGRDLLSQREHEHQQRSGREDDDVVAGDVDLRRCEDRAEREHDAGERHRGAEHEAERYVLFVLEVQRHAEDDVVELDAGEEDREQEDGDPQSARHADQRADQPLGAVDEQCRAGDEDEDRRHAPRFPRPCGPPRRSCFDERPARKPGFVSLARALQPRRNGRCDQRETQAAARIRDAGKAPARRVRRRRSPRLPLRRQP